MKTKNERDKPESKRQTVNPENSAYNRCIVHYIDLNSHFLCSNNKNKKLKQNN